MKQPYFILTAVAILIGCQPREDVQKSNGIKEVYLVQYRYLFPEDLENESDLHLAKIVRYAKLQIGSGKMEVWDGFFTDSITYSMQSFLSTSDIKRSLSYLAESKTDKSYYRDWENPDEPLVLYCGPELFFHVVNEDETSFQVGFVPYKLPSKIQALYESMNVRLDELKAANRITAAGNTLKDSFLTLIDDKLTPLKSFPPPLPEVQYDTN